MKPKSVKEDFIFKDNGDGTFTIAKYTGNDANVVIPAAWNVTRVYGFEDSTIRSITLPSTVTTIIGSAFSNCYSLQSVKLSEGLTAIQDFAFYNCSSLKSIKLPKSLKTINTMAFMRSGLTSIAIPEGVTHIPDFAFAMCYDLKSVKLPQSLKTIGSGAFNLCINLKSIQLPKGLTTIRQGAFGQCASLANIKIPDSVTTIEANAFLRCNALTSVTLPENLERIEGYTFVECFKLKSVKIPDSVKTIEDGAFSACRSITDVTLPGDPMTIGNDAFVYSPQDIRWHVFYGSAAEQYAVQHGYPVVYRKDYAFAAKEKSVERFIGETVGMDAFVSTPSNPAGAVFTLKSSSAKVLAVDAEALTAEAKAEGSATLTATMTVADPNNAKKPLAKKTASVKVKALDPNKLASVKIEGDAVRALTIGEELQLTALPTPDVEGVSYTWKSSKAAVAGVDESGLVTAVKKGSATITVTAKQGKRKKTASVKINVAEGA